MAGYPRVTHPSATKFRITRFHLNSVRLACVKHAASVHPEPGSNSLVKKFLSCQFSLACHFHDLLFLGCSLNNSFGIFRVALLFICQGTFEWNHSNGEGGIWTLAPLLTTCTLSRGVPSASWVLLHNKLTIQAIKLPAEINPLSPTERVGFEPTRPCGQTVFKTASLWPLRYLSKAFRFISGNSYDSKKSFQCQQLFNTFFYFFKSFF